MKIVYVQFVFPIPVHGEFHAITAWDVTKHGKTIKLEEKGNWLVLHLGGGKTQSIPMTRVEFITRAEVAPEAK